jgi:hypothetical protein
MESKRTFWDIEPITTNKCSRHNVSINTFYYNVRRLRHHACEVPEPVAQNVSLQPKVVPLEIINNSETISHPQLNQQTTPISINCNGIVVSIENGASPDTISAVVRALRADL